MNFNLDLNVIVYRFFEKKELMIFYPKTTIQTVLIQLIYFILW